MLVDKVDAFAHLILWISIGLSTRAVLQTWFDRLLLTVCETSSSKKKKVSGVFFFDNFLELLACKIFF